MNIGIDLDNTLVDLSAAACDLYNVKNQTEVPIETFEQWNAGEALGLSSTEFFQLLDEAWFYWDTYMELIEADAAHSIEELWRMGHTIHLISNRSYTSHKDVAAWLKQADIPYDVLTLIDVGKVEKLEFPIDVLIDDHPNLVQRAREHPFKMVLLYTQPWNKGLLAHDEFPPAPRNIFRVDNLHEAVEEIYRISR